MDSTNDGSIYVNINVNKFMKCTRCGSGLYYLNTSPDNPNNDTVNAYSFLTTVRANKEHFSRREIEGADTARVLQQRLAWPSTSDLTTYVADNQLINCTVTVDDINRVESV